jgi:hypothetical protein
VKEEYKSWLDSLTPGNTLWLQVREKLTLAQELRKESPGYEYYKVVCIEWRNDLLEKFENLLWVEGGGSRECISLLTGRVVNTSFNQRQLKAQKFLSYYPKPYIAIPDHWLEPKIPPISYPDHSPESFQWRETGFLM